MQIKKKILLPIIAILMLSLAQAANAATITGTAYGQQTGFLHFDYTTAVNPCDPVALTCPATPTYNPAAYHFGVKNEFYISPSNLNYGNTGSPAFTAKIQDMPCTDAKCNLTGFIN